MSGSPLVYASSRLRTPKGAPLRLPLGATERAAVPVSAFGVRAEEHDLTAQHAGEPQGQRVIVEGRVLDGEGRPVPRALVEVWQANAAGRYLHPGDQHPSPLDPNFTGRGRCLTDDQGRYRFVTVKPGAYPWKNHPNAWRPAHIHFSIFGHSFAERLVTQMYFPDDPLFFQDPIYNSVSDARARSRMIARFSLEQSVPDWALGFAFDVVLGGRDATPMDADLPPAREHR
jgi:protocatechuate 3,4-dioxygenase beta subunit